MFPNWAKNILFLLVYMLSGLVLVIIIEGLLSGAELWPFNSTIEQVMVGLRTPLLTNIFVLITNMGSPFVLFAVSCVIIALLLMQGQRYDALLIAFSMVVAVACFSILRNTFVIPRPGSDLINFTGSSFPSGHATVATTFFFALAHTFFSWQRTAVRKFVLVTLSILGAALVCLSRLYLGAHWALDILAGIAVGILSVSFSVLILGVLLQKKIEYLGYANRRNKKAL